MNNGIFKKFATLALASAAIGGGTLVAADEGEAGAIAPVTAVHVTKSISVGPEDTETGRARCPDGFVATGGGVRVPVDSPLMVESDSLSADGRGWEARVASVDEDDAEIQRVRLGVICAKGSTAAYSARSSAGR